MKSIKFFFTKISTKKSIIILSLCFLSIIVGMQIRHLERSSILTEQFFHKEIPNPSKADYYSNIKLSQENLELQSCGSKVSPKALFELIVLQRFKELNKVCFENYKRYFSSHKFDKVFKYKSLENIDVNVLRQQSFTSIYRFLNAAEVSRSSLDKEQVEFFTNTNFNDKKINENFISDMLSVSSHFEANHKRNEIQLKVYLFHQLPFDLRELEVFLDEPIIPNLVSSDAQILDFEIKKKNKQLKIIFPKSLVVDTTPITLPGKFEILPTIIDLKITLGNTVKLPFIQGISLNGKIANKKVITKLNTGINVTEDEEFNVCSSMAEFYEQWINNSHKNNSLVVDKKNKVITLKRNKYKINKNLYFPCDYSLVVEPGSKFLLGKDVSLFFTNSIRLIGTNDQKITVDAIDANQKWGSLVFLPNSDTSFLNKVKIHHFSASNGSGAYGFGRFFSGMLTILGASVDLNTLYLSDNGDDDLLNIINSQINIENIEFYNAFADGIDCDWCEGLMRSIKVNGTGVNGDGLDFSYSSINIIDIEVYDIGDKGISVGERSDVDIENLKVSNAIIGVASKDSSNVILNGGDFVKVKTPLTTYIKKPIFSEPTLHAYNVNYYLSGNNVAAKNTILEIRN